MHQQRTRWQDGSIKEDYIEAYAFNAREHQQGVQSSWDAAGISNPAEVPLSLWFLYT